MAIACPSYLQHQPRIANILVPTDFSPCSRTALPYACMLANQYCATVHFINVVGPPPMVSRAVMPHCDIEYDDHEAKRALEWLAGSLKLNSSPSTCSVRRGTVSEVLCRTIEESAIDILVMATHGRRGVRQFVLGSVAEQLIRCAPCPVLTVGPGAAAIGRTKERFATILAAIDLAPISLTLLAFARAMAVASGSELILFHAIPVDAEALINGGTCLDEAVGESMRQLSALAGPKFLKTQACIRIGPPAEAILEAAEGRNADLIVIGTSPGDEFHGRKSQAIAYEVVCGASCPVLRVVTDTSAHTNPGPGTRAKQDRICV